MGYKRKVHIGSRALERTVAREYEAKGFSEKRAEYIAGAVAGKVYREQMAKKKRR